MKLKSILLAGILAIPALFTTNAKANSIVKEHKELARTIVSLGVPVSINTNIHCPAGESGSYFAAGFMVICQDNRTANGKEVEWTANDLDTLRHEAHHLIQDCASGTIGDGKMYGDISLERAFQIANEKNLDIVELSPSSVNKLSICKYPIIPSPSH